MSDTPRTDEYERDYIHWQAYAKVYGHIPEAMEQCPLEDDPIGMMRKYECEAAALREQLAAERKAREEAEAQPVPQGMTLVPVEPTNAIRHAIWNAFNNPHQGWSASSVYDAMLAASKETPT